MILLVQEIREPNHADHVIGHLDSSTLHMHKSLIWKPKLTYPEGLRVQFLV